MNGTTTTIRKHSDQEMRGFRSFMWMSMVMSLGVVFFGIQLMMVGPLKGRLDNIQARLNVSESNMGKLVAARESVFRTNDLLTTLNEQAGRLDDLQSNIASIETLRSTVTKESEAASSALAALEQMKKVQERLIATQQQTTQASAQLAAMSELQQAILNGSHSTEVAQNSLDGLVALQNRLIAVSNNYDQASEGVSNMADLTQRVITQSEDLQMAVQKFDEFVGLKDSVRVASADIDRAKADMAGLNSLLGDLSATGEKLSVAQENTRTMVAMNETLSGSASQLESAQQSLDSLISMQDSLVKQSDQVAAAIQNLEIMDDFRVEVASHVDSLEQLRHTLMELAMMESTLGRVASVVEPLTQIGNLRRLSDEEVREAARVILDRRSTRFSQSESDTVSDQSRNAPPEASSSSQEIPVPLPPEAR
ncbi:MAG: hypothetical protein ACK58L_05540 [Planctomycetota bacterium]